LYGISDWAVNDKTLLRNIYLLYVDRDGIRSAIVENELDYEAPIQISQDYMRNEPYNYKSLFRVGDNPLITQLYRKLLCSMHGKQFEECDDEFAGLAFLKAVIMKALGLYQADHSTHLAKFANEFDRLDIYAVRQKLYALAQAGQF
jgi:hypothetical protein